MKTNFGTFLSRTEMKELKGGVADPTHCHCTCEGGTGGSWTYTGEPSAGTISQDIQDYCSTGAATCGSCSNL